MALARRKAITTGVICGAFALVVASSLSWACTGLATLSSSSATARAGQTVEVSGEGFAKQGGAVSVRVDSGWGEVLATAQPDRNGKFSASVNVPELTPGEHVLLAVQPDIAGSAILATGSLPLSVVADLTGAAMAPASLSPVPGPAAYRATAVAASTPTWGLLVAAGLGAGLLLAVGVSMALLRCRATAPSPLVVTHRSP